MSMGSTIALIKALAPVADPEVVAQAVEDWLDDHPEAVAPIDDTAGEGDTDKLWSADKTAGEVATLTEAITPLTPAATSGDVGKFLKAKTVSGGKVTEYEFGSAGGGGSVDLFYVTPEDYGAVGDGETDDSQAVQDAVDAGKAVYFAAGKTYYIPTAIEIDHDCRLFGGEGTTIKTETVSGSMNNIFVASGTLKKTTTLTTDYVSDGGTDNAGNQFTLSDMTGIAINDIMVIEATDQYYNYSRQYYYLGGTLLIGDIYNGHLYTTTNLPFDIENTENVSVKIYSAPQIIIEGLNFVADMESGGNYKYFVVLNQCRNSIVRNCRMTEMDSGIRINNCFNTLFESVELSKSKELNTRQGDGYGIAIYSSTNTVVERVNAICAQSCVCLSGDVTCFNTYIKHCSLCAECRPNAIGSHENAYNTVVEDCTLTGVNILGTGIVNRCRFIKNNRVSTSTAISFCGSHNPKYATLKVSNCIFEGELGVYLYPSSPQNPIQAFDNIYGLVEITDCDGGSIIFEGTTTQYILSNVIKELRLTNWTNCKEVYLPNATDVIEKMVVKDCTFTNMRWINDHNNHLMVGNAKDLEYSSAIPMMHKMTVNKDTMAERYTLPENVSISLSATSQSAKYVICGNNLAPNNAEDICVGNVSGSDGGTLTRTVNTGNSVPTVTIDSGGNVVFTQKNNTSNYCMFPVGLFYVKETGSVKMSAKIKSESAVKFRPYIAIVDCKTGKLISRYLGSAVEATAAGATISYEHGVSADNAVLCYFYCSTPIANAVTTFEDYVVYIENMFAPSTADSIQPYEAKRRTGDGTILSLPGVNNIMCSENVFHVSFGADFVENPIV